MHGGGGRPCLYVPPGKGKLGDLYGGRCNAADAMQQRCEQQQRSPACLERWCASSASHLLNCSPHLWQLSPPEEPLPAPCLVPVSSQDARWPFPFTTEPFLSSSTFGDLGGVQRTPPPRTEPLYGRPCPPAPAHAGPGVPGRSVPTNDDTTPPSASCAAPPPAPVPAPTPTAASPPQPAPKPVILSSQRELVLSTTSCAMGLRNSLLPIDRGLQLPRVALASVDHVAEVGDGARATRPRGALGHDRRQVGAADGRASAPAGDGTGLGARDVDLRRLGAAVQRPLEREPHRRRRRLPRRRRGLVLLGPRRRNTTAATPEGSSARAPPPLAHRVRS
jgi:hypothetical protein